jgi:hypothetical protein
MSTSLVRMKFAAVAVKIEATPGGDAIGGTPANSDFIAADCEVDFDPQLIDNPELTGTLDKAPSIVGGLRPRIRLRLPLRGSATPDNPPEWGKLLKCCTMAETITSAAVGAPTAATAGTFTSITLAAPFATTAQQYRGMPLLLTGDRTVTTGITDYTAGRVATVAESMATAATISTLAQIPKNVLYTPTSDESVFKTCTLYFYADGLNWRFCGAQGTWTLELTTGGIGFLTFEMRAIVVAFTGAALPTGWNTAQRATPPRFVNGRCVLAWSKAQCRTLTMNFGVQVVLPDDPEGTEGYGPAVSTERDPGGSIDPLMNTTNAVSLYDYFRTGTPVPLMAVVGASAGNRFIVVAPAAKATGLKPGARDGLGQNAITFQLDGADSSVFLAQF